MNRLAIVYGRHFLGIEAAFAALLTAAFAFWTTCYCGWSVVESVLRGNRGAVYGTVASVCGSLLGFTIAAVAIVLGYAQSERLTILRESDSWAMLWRVFTASMRSLGFATLAALAALLLDRDNSQAHLAVYACVMGLLLALFRVTRVLWVLEGIIQIATKPLQDQQQPHPR